MGIVHGVVRLLGGDGDEQASVEDRPYTILQDQPSPHNLRHPSLPHSCHRPTGATIHGSGSRPTPAATGTPFVSGTRPSHPSEPAPPPSQSPSHYGRRPNTNTVLGPPLQPIIISKPEGISSTSIKNVNRIPWFLEKEKMTVLGKIRVVVNEEISPASVEDIKRIPFLEKSKATPVNEGRWIKHYSSCHRILLVGEGDFSFSACLALAFGCSSNMIATSLDTKAFLEQNYRRAASNINELTRRGCKVLHGIDATKMANHELLGRHDLMFDRIIFNFPYAGFFKDLPRSTVLRRHRRLVSLFLKNAKEMVSKKGEIHVTHKTNSFHIEWKLDVVAASHRLPLIEAVEFNLRDYTGYQTKRGFGGDNNFNCYPSKTYKFALPY